MAHHDTPEQLEHDVKRIGVTLPVPACPRVTYVWLCFGYALAMFGCVLAMFGYVWKWLAMCGYALATFDDDVNRHATNLNAPA